MEMVIQIKEALDDDFLDNEECPYCGHSGSKCICVYDEDGMIRGE